MLLAIGFSFGLIAQNAQQAAAPVAKEESIFMNPTFLILSYSLSRDCSVRSQQMHKTLL